MTNSADKPFSRDIPVATVADKGIQARVEASTEERIAIAKLLDLIALDELSFDYTLSKQNGERFVLDGLVQARVTQSCVLSLDPIESMPSIPINAQFWPEADLAEAADSDGAVQVDPEDDGPEPIVDGQIDIGHFAYEHFAAALDPYPKKSEATFDWSDARAGSNGEGMDGPFAALKSLKEQT